MRLKNLDSGPFHAPAICEPSKWEDGVAKVGRTIHESFVLAPGEVSKELSDEHYQALKEHPGVKSRCELVDGLAPKPGHAPMKIRFLAWEGAGAGRRAA